MTSCQNGLWPWDGARPLHTVPTRSSRYWDKYFSLWGAKTSPLVGVACFKPLARTIACACIRQLCLPRDYLAPVVTSVTMDHKVLHAMDHPPLNFTLQHSGDWHIHCPKTKASLCSAFGGILECGEITLSFCLVWFSWPATFYLVHFLPLKEHRVVYIRLFPSLFLLYSHRD